MQILLKVEGVSVETDNYLLVACLYMLTWKSLLCDCDLSPSSTLDNPRLSCLSLNLQANFFPFVSLWMFLKDKKLDLSKLLYPELNVLQIAEVTIKHTLHIVHLQRCSSVFNLMIHDTFNHPCVILLKP